MTQEKPIVSFLGNLRQPAKSLTGFEKHHRIPAGSDSKAARFIRERGKKDIEHDLDAMFKQLRDRLGYKRRDFFIAGPIDGTGSIQVPDFEYRVQIIHDTMQPEFFFWERTVVSISSLAIVTQPSFQSIFDRFLSSMIVEFPEPLDIPAIIDHVEDLADNNCSIDYDRDATWCEIGTSDTNAKMEIRAQQVMINGATSMGVADLLHSYLHLQERFLETIDLPGEGLRVSPA